MKYLIRHILKENLNDKFLKLIVEKMKSGRMSPPFFKKFRNMGLSDQEIESIMEDFFGEDISIDGNNVFNSKNKLTYYESWESTKWEILLYNKFNKIYYREDSRGNKKISEYDENGHLIHQKIIKEEYSPAGKEYTPGRYIVHISNPSWRDNIELTGLQVSIGDCYQEYVGGDVECKKSIFATDSMEKKYWFDSTYDDDVWLIDTECAGVTWFKDRHFDFGDYGYHIVTFENIKPNCLKLVHKGTGKSW